MKHTQTFEISQSENFLLRRAADYFKLLKFRLTTVVVFSAIFGFLMASEGSRSYLDLLFLALGGFFVTGSANILNQVIEADHDRLMTRTAKRPMARKSLHPLEAIVYALAIGIAGILILGFKFNLTTALLGIIAILSYAFVYTPLKRIHPIAVLVGAFPGAMPPLIGWAAGAGELAPGAFILFAIQFLWQFPHFWAIAWVLDEDYKKAGFKMLPVEPGRSRMTALLVFIYTSLLVPFWILPYFSGFIGGTAAIICVVASILFAWQSLNLFRKISNKAALQLMFGSFLYLPLIQILILIDHLN